MDATANGHRARNKIPITFELGDGRFYQQQPQLKPRLGVRPHHQFSSPDKFMSMRRQWFIIKPLALPQHDLTTIPPQPTNLIAQYGAAMTSISASTLQIANP